MDKNKSHQWNFAFDAMPILFHSQTDSFMKFLDKDGVKFLKFWWDHVGDKLEESRRVSAAGLTFDCEDIDKKTRLAIITLPSPRADGEAYFLGMVARPERRFAMVRLYTSDCYVLFRDDSVNQPHRTTLAYLTPQAHVRPRGVGLTPTLQEFRRVIKYRLEKKKK